MSIVLINYELKIARDRRHLVSWLNKVNIDFFSESIFVFI